MGEKEPKRRMGDIPAPASIAKLTGIRILDAQWSQADKRVSKPVTSSAGGGS
jgi:hypothetical protein